MNLEQLKKLVPGLDLDEIEVNPTDQLEEYFFRQRQGVYISHGYKNDTIEFSVANRIPLVSTFNNVSNMAERFLAFRCSCGHEMKYTGGGGNGSVTSLNYKCGECGIEGCLIIPTGGISLTFPAKQEQKEE